MKLVAVLVVLLAGGAIGGGYWLAAAPARHRPQPSLGGSGYCVQDTEGKRTWHYTYVPGTQLPAGLEPGFCP